jgi:hypothetical protein
MASDFENFFWPKAMATFSPGSRQEKIEFVNIPV